MVDAKNVEVNDATEEEVMNETTIVEKDTAMDKVKGFVIKHKTALAVGGAVVLGGIAVAVKVLLTNGEDVSVIDIEEVIDLESVAE